MSSTAALPGRLRYGNRDRVMVTPEGIALPLTLAFVLPAGLLLRMALNEGDAQFGPRYLALLQNSLFVSAVAAVLAVALAVVFAYGARLASSRLPSALIRVVALGYALPGAVIALSDTAVQFDFNHPLAGQPVTFEVKLIGVL